MQLPLELNSPVPIYTPGIREALWELSVLPEKNLLTIRAPRLHIDNYTGFPILLGSHAMKLDDLDCHENWDFFRTLTGWEDASVRGREILRRDNVTKLFCTICLKF